MKNKKLTYLLLIVVAIVWFQVLNRFNFFSEAEFEENNQSTGTIQMVKIERNHFVINANYRDPFDVGGYERAKEEPPKNDVPKPILHRPTFQWPSIVYYGIVKKTQSKTPLALIEIEGYSLMLRRNDWIYDDFQIRSIYRDSIIISHAKERKTIKRQEL